MGPADDTSIGAASSSDDRWTRRVRGARGPAGPRRQPDPTLTAALLAAAVGLATFVLGFWHAGRSYNYDEAVTIDQFVSTGSPRFALTHQVYFNNHPMFSAIQSIVWRLGLTTESTQRITPVLFGALAVGIVAWWTTRRWGWAPGLAGAATLALNPMFLGQLRSVRGYSLAALAVVVASVAVAEWCRERRPWLLVLQGVAMVVAVTTHAYSVLPLLMLAVGLAAAGLLDRRLVRTWVAAAAATVLISLPILDDTLDASRVRGRQFRSDFPGELWRAVVGEPRLIWLIVAFLAGVGVVTTAQRSPRHRRGVFAASVTAVAFVAAVWLLARPTDLYPRFFVALVPLVAVAVAAGVAALPTHTAPAAPVLLLLLLAPGARDVARNESGIRWAADMVDAGRALGLEVCGRNLLPLAVYTDPPRFVTTPDALAGCDLYVSVGGPPAPVLDAADERFPHRWAERGITVFAIVDRPTLERSVGELGEP